MQPPVGHNLIASHQKMHAVAATKVRHLGRSPQRPTLSVGVIENSQNTQHEGEDERRSAPE